MEDGEAQFTGRAAEGVVFDSAACGRYLMHTAVLRSLAVRAGLWSSVERVTRVASELFSRWAAARVQGTPFSRTATEKGDMSALSASPLVVRGGLSKLEYVARDERTVHDELVRALHAGPLYHGLRPACSVTELSRKETRKRRLRGLDVLLKQSKNLSHMMWAQPVDRIRMSVAKQLWSAPQYWALAASAPSKSGAAPTMSFLEKGKVVRYMMWAWVVETAHSGAGAIAAGDLEAVRCYRLSATGALVRRGITETLTGLQLQQRGMLETESLELELGECLKALAAVASLLVPPEAGKWDEAWPGQVHVFDVDELISLLATLLARAVGNGMKVCQEALKSGEKAKAVLKLPVVLGNFVSTMYNMVRRQVAQDRRNKSQIVLTILDKAVRIGASGGGTDARTWQACQVVDHFAELFHIPRHKLDIPRNRKWWTRHLERGKVFKYAGRFVVPQHADLAQLDVSSDVLKAVWDFQRRGSLSGRVFVCVCLGQDPSKPPGMPRYKQRLGAAVVEPEAVVEADDGAAEPPLPAPGTGTTKVVTMLAEFVEAELTELLMSMQPPKKNAPVCGRSAAMCTPAEVAVAVQPEVSPGGRPGSAFVVPGLSPLRLAAADEMLSTVECLGGTMPNPLTPLDPTRVRRRVRKRKRRRHSSGTDSELITVPTAPITPGKVAPGKIELVRTPKRPRGLCQPKRLFV
ncbi:uncharacterized protein AMSG_08126 [Thecamonas trahens ATCC 50062]|uniref:Uncharacterized protein n=1 Tax=Thecamonas trahens ATCC 50062 TaxID=461836 RepID=A0A0L0DJJ3_THETB|nr:hypothetical protein AMSG_08126 [Thecamonas trahens ATCC 50062]KNC52559.1 hypothetical protein AMSG_08126 [Thecamonas trahens ATCC 50062]|eukprot:XP_013755349.1 hypothetical protein AMSG_08126 [Thecamonas trahens ATCC 50062]